jgi:hypothetical protein
VSGPSAFDVELAIEKLKTHKSPGINRIPAELFKTGDRTNHPDICKINNPIWNKEKSPEKWK